MAREPGAAFFAGGRFAVGEDGGEYAALPRNSAVGPDVTNRCVSCHDIAVGANPLAGAAAVANRYEHCGSVRLSQLAVVREVTH